VVVSLHAGAILQKSHVCFTKPGHLLVAVPAADDLIELRELVQGTACGTRSR
jgi:hypothetical protein